MNPILLRKIVFPGYHWLKKTGVMQKIKELEFNQRLTPSELRQLQIDKRETLLKYVYRHVPYYRNLFRELGVKDNDFRSSEWFRRIPLLDKGKINKNREQIKSDSLDKNRLFQNSTSGSTGEALYFYTDLRSWAYRRATVIRNQNWLGVELGDRTASLWGAPMDLNVAAQWRGRMHSWINNLKYLSSYDLSQDTLNNYVKSLNHFKPRLLIAYPGPLSVFAEYLIKSGQRIPTLKAIISSAETLYPWQKEIIENAFDCMVFNRYGCREFGDIAQECSYREGLHLHTDRVFLEILDQKLKPVKDGETGELVITDLDNYGFPLIRYRIGDIGALKFGQCSCGLSLPLLSRIEGRTLDVVKSPNGNSLGGTFWSLLLKSRPGIKSFQVIQEKSDGVVIKYVRDPLVEEIDCSFFTKKIAEKCGKNFKIVFSEVKEIEKTSAGKTRFVISKLE